MGSAVVLALKWLGSGILSAAKALWGFVLAYPKTAAAFVGAIALVWLHFHLVHRAEAAAIAVTDAKWQAKQDAADKDFQTAINAKRARIADLVLAQQAASDRFKADQSARDAAHKAELAKRLKEIPRYVTPLADSRCIVPVGFLQHAGKAVDAANGKPILERQDAGEAVSAEAMELVNRPSAIPLSAVDDWIQRTLDVGKRWRERALNCDAWVDQQAAIFNSGG